MATATRKVNRMNCAFEVDISDLVDQRESWPAVAIRLERHARKRECQSFSVGDIEARMEAARERREEILRRRRCHNNADLSRSRVEEMDRERRERCLRRMHLRELLAASVRRSYARQRFAEVERQRERAVIVQQHERMRMEEFRERARKLDFELNYASMLREKRRIAKIDRCREEVRKVREHVERRRDMQRKAILSRISVLEDELSKAEEAREAMEGSRIRRCRELAARPHNDQRPQLTHEAMRSFHAELQQKMQEASLRRQRALEERTGHAKDDLRRVTVVRASGQPQPPAHTRHAACTTASPRPPRRIRDDYVDMCPPAIAFSGILDGTRRMSAKEKGCPALALAKANSTLGLGNCVQRTESGAIIDDIDYPEEESQEARKSESVVAVAETVTPLVPRAIPVPPPLPPVPSYHRKRRDEEAVPSLVIVDSVDLETEESFEEIDKNAADGAPAEQPAGIVDWALKLFYLR